MDPVFPQDCDAVKAQIDDPATDPITRTSLQALWSANCDIPGGGGADPQSGGVPIKHPPKLP